MSEKMIRIGFDDQVEEYNFSKEEMDDEVHPKGRLFSKMDRKPIYISPEREKEILKGMDCVVVHDFGDEYHLSEEERRAKNKFYETFKILRRTKKNYKRLDQYISVMRDAMKCLDAVAESNGVYDPDEFKLLFLQGDIEICGLKFPKYRGKDKKSLSWNYIAQFIMSDEDPSILIKKRNDDVEFMTDNDLIERGKKLFGERKFEEILKSADCSSPRRTRYFDPDEDDPADNGYALIASDKDTRKMMKDEPGLLDAFKEIKRSMNTTKHLDSFAYDLNMSAIEAIESYDRKHASVIDNGDIPEFTGDIMNDDDYYRYLARLRDYEEENIVVDYHGRRKSLSEARELDIRSGFEESGWDIRAFNENKAREKKLKQAQKKDKKREKRLKEQLLKIEKRRALREESSYSTKKKKKKKKKDDGDD